MRIVLQRVSHASVRVGERVKSTIGKGYLILLGIGEDDNEGDVSWLTKKIIGLRVFDDDCGVMNRNIIDEKGDILVVSQLSLIHI